MPQLTEITQIHFRIASEAYRSKAGIYGMADDARARLSAAPLPIAERVSDQ
jgi:hypothetical protein